MSRRSPHSTYFADDKDIYDLLVAAKQKLTPARLVEFARRRGIVLSPTEEREALIEQISLFPFSSQQLGEIIALTDTEGRKEKSSSRVLSGSVSRDDIQDALAVVKSERDGRGESYVSQLDGEALRVTVGYSELDTSRTRLAQKTERSFTIEVEFLAGGEAVVRHQDQPRAHEIVTLLTERLNSRATESVVEDKIELSGVRDPMKRTEFFMKLIGGIKGHELPDVKSVRASCFQRLDDDALDGLEVDEEDGRIDDVDEPDRNGSVDVRVGQFVAAVKEVALKGDSLLDTPHYDQLAKDGFFIRSLVWTCVDKSPNAPKVEFEAGFDNAEEFTGFSYQVRGTYARKSDGDFRVTKSLPSPTERTRLLRLLEEAARSARTAISPNVEREGERP